MAQIGSWLRDSRLHVAAALVVIVAAAIYLRMPGWNPGSLYLDDQWVALLVREVSMGRILELHPPSPPGFIALLKAVTGPQPQPWRWQLLNFLAIAVQIPLFALAIGQVTQSRSLGMVAAALLAVNPTLALHSLRAKHYAIESLLVVALLTLAICTLQRRQLRPLIAMTLLGAASVLFSFPCLLVAGVLLNLAALGLAMPGQAPACSRKHVAAVAAAGNLALLALYFGIVRGYAHEGIIEAWQSHYIPLSSAGAAWDFFITTGYRAWRGALPADPPAIAATLVLIPIGIAWLVRNKPQRALGMAIALLMIAVIALSALRRYPLGGGRTDIYTFPLTLTAVLCGLAPLLRLHRHMSPLIAAAGLLVLGFNVSPRFGYPETGDRAIAEQLAMRIHPDDALIVYPWANWAIGLYGPWPGYTIPSLSSNAFYFELERPRTLVLNGEVEGYDSFINDPAVLIDQLRPLLAQRPRRIAYYAIEADTKASMWIPQYIARHGYVPVANHRAGKAMFIMLERPPTPQRESPAEAPGPATETREE